MTAENPSVILERQGAVATITFNRPTSLNAIDVDLAERFRDACLEVAADRSVRAVVLKGEGRAFMAGGDLAAMHREPGDGIVRRILGPLHAALNAVASMRAPVVASLHGAVAGAGLSLAMATDLAIAAEDTRFTLAYTKIGANPDGSSSWFLPRIVGLRKAMEIALLADVFDASEAYRLGLVNKVVPAAALAAETEALAQRLAAGPTDAYGRTKALLRASFQRDLPGQLEAELAAFATGTATADFAEGVGAFLEKRAPRFQGR